MDVSTCVEWSYYFRCNGREGFNEVTSEQSLKESKEVLLHVSRKRIHREKCNSK